MAKEPLFGGLVIDEFDNPVEVSHIGSEPAYVVNDAGFRRHIPAEEVDLQVLAILKEQIEQNKDLLLEQTSKMLGQEDIFSRAMLQKQLENIDKQMENLYETGLPEEARAYMGMVGFKVIIDIHGQVLRVEQPSKAAEEGDE